MEDRIWSVSEAKARLSEILRLSDAQGPQTIGMRQSYVVVPAAQWKALTEDKPPLGAWLLANAPRGVELDLPSRADPPRPSPFADDEGE